MAFLDQLYGGSLSLLSDLYQLTMAYGYWATEARDREAVYHLFFRHAPFGDRIAISAGLQQVVEYLQRLHYSEQDLSYLAGLKGSDGRALFHPEFLAYLRDFEFCCDIDAVPEGTALFADQPMLRVRGPIIQCQLLETSLANLMNFQTLIASKAARVKYAAGDDPVLEFGLRRAQGVDGGMCASRAAYLGGASATSNVLAGKLFGIPVKGTHAHSWVMAFAGEQEAFDAYQRALPNNAILLVDTYDTLRGVEHAIATGHKLRARGYSLSGIRLDSGDVAHLAHEARRMLDEAGFKDTQIVASGDLDEQRIHAFRKRGVPIDVWGVGTKLVTGDDYSALTGVYKLSAVRSTGGQWQYRVKLSDSPDKISTPGIQQIRRYSRRGQFVADTVFDQGPGGADHAEIAVEGTPRRLPHADAHEDLLVPIFQAGRRVYQMPPLEAVRARAIAQYAAFHARGMADYPAGLERRLCDSRARVMASMRNE